MSLATSSPLSNGGSDNIRQSASEARLEALTVERRKCFDVYRESDYYASLVRTVKALEELKAAFADLDRQNTAEVELMFIRQDLMDNRGCRFIANLEQVATEAAGFMWTVNALAELFYSHDAIVPQPDELTEGDTDTDATPCAVVGGKDGGE